MVKSKGLAKHITEELRAYEAANNDKKKTRAVEKLSKLLLKLRKCLYGDANHVPSKEEMLQSGAEIQSVLPSLIPLLVHGLKILEFEARKDAVLVFTFMTLHEHPKGTVPLLDYVVSHPPLLEYLFERFDNENLHVHVYEMLKSCVAGRQVARLLLLGSHSHLFYRLFELQAHADFSVCTDAADLFRDLLTRHVDDASRFLVADVVRFFDVYHEKLLRASNFVTRRQALELLGRLLVEPKNLKMRVYYINNRKYLVLIMRMLCDNSPVLQRSAYHVFKLFIANPNKDAKVEQVLFLNRDRIMKFLKSLEGEKGGDDTALQTELEFLRTKLKRLKDCSQAAKANQEIHKPSSSMEATTSSSKGSKTSTKRVSSSMVSSPPEARKVSPASPNQPVSDPQVATSASKAM